MFSAPPLGKIRSGYTYRIYYDTAEGTEHIETTAEHDTRITRSNFTFNHKYRVEYNEDTWTLYETNIQSRVRVGNIHRTDIKKSEWLLSKVSSKKKYNLNELVKYLKKYEKNL